MIYNYIVLYWVLYKILYYTILYYTWVRPGGSHEAFLEKTLRDPLGGPGSV